MKREYGDYIEDIIRSVNDVEEFTRGMSYDDFIQDKKTIYAVIRALEVLGEAAKNIPHSIRDNYPHVPWRKMAGMRDKLIHQYFGVDLEILWKMVQKDLTHLKPLMENFLDDLEG